MPSFQPYWGKPAVRNDRGDRGDVGIIRSPVRASILPDCGGCPAMGIPTAILHPKLSLLPATNFGRLCPRCRHLVSQLVEPMKDRMIYIKAIQDMQWHTYF